MSLCLCTHLLCNRNTCVYKRPTHLHHLLNVNEHQRLLLNKSQNVGLWIVHKPFCFLAITKITRIIWMHIMKNGNFSDVCANTNSFLNAHQKSNVRVKLCTSKWTLFGFLNEIKETNTCLGDLWPCLVTLLVQTGTKSKKPHKVFTCLKPNTPELNF